MTLNSWHNLRVKRIGRRFLVRLNGEDNTSDLEAFTKGTFVQLSITDYLYLGGHPDADGISALLPEYSKLVSYNMVKGFSGCVQSVSIYFI